MPQRPTSAMHLLIMMYRIVKALSNRFTNLKSSPGCPYKIAKPCIKTECSYVWPDGEVTLAAIHERKNLRFRALVPEIKIKAIYTARYCTRWVAIKQSEVICRGSKPRLSHRQVLVSSRLYQIRYDSRRDLPREILELEPYISPR